MMALGEILYIVSIVIIDIFKFDDTSIDYKKI